MNPEVKAWAFFTFMEGHENPPGQKPSMADVYKLGLQEGYWTDVMTKPKTVRDWIDRLKEEFNKTQEGLPAIMDAGMDAGA